MDTPERETEPTRGSRSFLRDAYAILTGRIAVQIANFITGILVARLLGVEGKGLVAAAILAPTMIRAIAEFGVRNAAAYHIGRETWPFEKIVQTTLFTSLLTGTLGAALCVGWLLLTWEEHYTPALVVVTAASLPFAIVMVYVGGIFLGLNRISEFALSNWAPAVGKLFGTALFVGLMGLGVVGAVGAMTAAMAGVAGIMLWHLSKITPLRVAYNPEIMKKMTAIGSSYAIAYFLMTLVYRANIFLVQIFGGIEQLGYYSLGANLAELLWQIPAVLSAIVFTRSASAKDSRKFSQKVAVLVRLTFVTGLLAAFFAAAVAHSLVPLIYGAEFAPSANVLIALLPGSVAMVIFKLLRQDLSGRGLPWAAVWVIAPMLVAAGAAGAVVIPAYGALGAAIMMSVVYILGTAGLIWRYAAIVDLTVAEIITPRRGDVTQLVQAVRKVIDKRRGAA